MSFGIDDDTQCKSLGNEHQPQVANEVKSFHSTVKSFEVFLYKKIYAV